jgi:Protein of unknown function (DUF2490)
MRLLGIPQAVLRAALLLPLIPTVPAAQDRRLDHNFHGWYAYFGDHPVANTRWGVHLEGQFRRHNGITQWQQLLLRPGVNYQATKALTLTAGYAFVRSHRYSDYAAPASAFNEHRIWQQAWLRYRTGKVAWSTRLRFENRFIATGDGHRFENRLRTWQQATVPVSRRAYLTAYDEVWFYVKPYVSASAFDQNRAYGAVGLHLSPHWRMEAGYMNQSLLQRSGRVLESNHTIVISLFSNAVFSRR